MMDFLAKYKLPKLPQEVENRKKAVAVDGHWKSAGSVGFIS